MNHLVQAWIFMAHPIQLGVTYGEPDTNWVYLWRTRQNKLLIAFFSLITYNYRRLNSCLGACQAGRSAGWG